MAHNCVSARTSREQGQMPTAIRRPGNKLQGGTTWMSSTSPALSTHPCHSVEELRMTTLARLLFPEYFGKGFLFPHTTSSIPHILDTWGDNKKLEHNHKAWTSAHRQQGDGCCVQTWHTAATLAGHQPPPAWPVCSSAASPQSSRAFGLGTGRFLVHFGPTVAKVCSALLLLRGL